MRLYTKKIAGIKDRARAAAGAFRREAGRIDEEDAIPPGLLELLWESGFMSLRAPRVFGGGDMGLPECVVAVEELARGCGAAGLIVMLQALGMSALREFGSEKQGKEWWPRILEARSSCAFALSEPAGEPGAKSKVTFAKKIKSEYYLRGKKTFVSGARDADLVTVFAVSSPTAGLKSALSAFLVPAGTAGLLPGRELTKSGLRGVPAVELWLEGCRVPAGSRIGKPGQGYEIARRAMVMACPLASALACGLLAEAVDYALAQVRERAAAVGPLSEFQPLELTLAELSAGLDSALALTWAAAGTLEDKVSDGERLAREAKWTATEAAVHGLDSAARLFGIESSLKGSPLERLGRDARTCQLLLGPNHIHRIEVARKLIRGGKKK